jgi:hypothetical protein
MRIAVMLSFLVLVQAGWTMNASGRTPPALAGRQFIIIPTAFEQLTELRVNTGEKAVLRDGTWSAVYVMKTPAVGGVFLNFHVDLASGAGPFVLHANEIRLTKPSFAMQAFPVEATRSPARFTNSSPVSYIPMDWFIDTGMAEVRGDSVRVQDKAIVQFTIEVPRAGFDDLTLFVRSQRVGTVSEIRARIASFGGAN